MSGLNVGTRQGMGQPNDTPAALKVRDILLFFELEWIMKESMA